MKKIKFGLSYILITFLGLATIFAQVDLISADDFAQLMKSNDDLVIVDANKSKGYKASHIKNAVHINHLDLYQDGDIAGVLMEPIELAAFFGSKGISEKSPVVVYDDGSQKYSTRVYWTLKYLGAEDVKIVHRNMDAWRKARIALTSTASSSKAMTFTPNVNASLNVPLEYVKKHKDDPNAILVDARTPDEYAGIKSSEGHIPGAINLNYLDILDEDGGFLPMEKIKAIFSEKEITPEKEIILYCKTSVRAAVLYVALKNILGYENVKIYDGAYNEWLAKDTIVQ